MSLTKPNFQTLAVALLTTTLTYAAEALPLASGSHSAGIHTNNNAIDTPAFGEADFLKSKTSISKRTFTDNNKEGDNTPDDVNSFDKNAHTEKNVIISGSPICGNVLFSHVQSMEKEQELLEIDASLEDLPASSFDAFFSIFAHPPQQIDLVIDFESTNKLLDSNYDASIQAENKHQDNVFTQQNHLIEFPEPVGFCPFVHSLFRSGDENVTIEDEYANMGLSLALSPEDSFQFTFDQFAGAAPEAIQPALAEATAVPEPGILSIIGIGLLGIAWLVRRRQLSRCRT